MTAEEKPIPQIIYKLKGYYQRMDEVRQEHPEKPPYGSAEGAILESKAKRIVDESRDPQLQSMLINLQNKNREVRLWLGLITD